MMRAVRQPWTWSLILVAGIVLVGRGDPPQDENDQWHKQLQEIAKTYLEYERVDEEKIRWAPELCSRPELKPSVARSSQSDDPETHGQKLYFMYAKDKEAYVKLSGPQPAGQVIVKQSWHPERMPDDFTPDPIRDRRYDRLDSKTRSKDPDDLVRGGFWPYAQRDGHWYEAKEQKDLFVMMKQPADTPGTDNGWVYGVVSKQGKVLAAGKIDSCIQCHEQASPDRMFGLPK